MNTENKMIAISKESKETIIGMLKSLEKITQNRGINTKVLIEEYFKKWSFTC